MGTTITLVFTRKNEVVAAVAVAVAVVVVVVATALMERHERQNIDQRM